MDGSMPEVRGHIMRQYYVYIMTNHSGTLYTGMTNDLIRRVGEHKCKEIRGFTARYNITRLVYYEETPDVRSAIAREKQIKGWVRAKKVALIEAANPRWRDLSAEWDEFKV
jgi:putative endonuclease